MLCFVWGRNVRPPIVKTYGDRPMKIGSTIRLSETFLRDIDASPSDALRYAVGTITELDGIGQLAVATVRWNDARISRYDATRNLVIAD